QVVAPVAETAGVAAPLLVDAWLVLADIAARRGDVGPARAALRQAVRFAAPETQRRAFQEVGAQLRQLFRDAGELEGQCQIAAGSTTYTGQVPPDGALPGAAELIIVDPLSKREMEVLRQMAAMVPTEEIAASLYVSVNTVKTHVRSILRKLS